MDKICERCGNKTKRLFSTKISIPHGNSAGGLGTVAYAVCKSCCREYREAVTEFFSFLAVRQKLKSWK